MALSRHEAHELHDILCQLRESLEVARENRHLLHRILAYLEPHYLTVTVTPENPMTITAGAQGTFTAQLEDNGNPIPLPSGSTFTWSADDPNATLAPAADTLSVEVAVPASGTATAITVTASTVAPDGTTVSGSAIVDIAPGVAQVFTVTVSQTA